MGERFIALWKDSSTNGDSSCKKVLDPLECLGRLCAMGERFIALWKDSSTNGDSSCKKVLDPLECLGRLCAMGERFIALWKDSTEKAVIYHLSLCQPRQPGGGPALCVREAREGGAQDPHAVRIKPADAGAP